jgi:hypothetical protein
MIDKLSKERKKEKINKENEDPTIVMKNFIPLSPL